MSIYKKTIACLLIFCLNFSLMACGSPEAKEFTGKAKNLNHTLYICSDLHLLANSLVDKQRKKEDYTSDGRVQAYDYDLVEALIDKVNEDKPEALILTGDLSYNGESLSHLELVKMLEKVDKDVKVLVIPGNHDTYILDGLVPDCDTTDETFRELYKNCGYTGALSYDQGTLSYAYELGDDLLAVMLDTALCRYNPDEGDNIMGGYVTDDTLSWLEDILIKARGQNKRIVCFTHHNVLDHGTGFDIGYTLYENEHLVDLLMKYDVELNFSGHLHIQNIATETKEGKSLYDIASSSLLTYSNTVGRLRIYSDGFTYDKEALVPFEGFTEMSREHFADTYYNKSLDRFTAKYGDDAEAVLRFTALCNALYFDGDYQAVMAERRQNQDLLDLIEEKTTDQLSHYFRVDDSDQRLLSGYWSY